MPANDATLEQTTQAVEQEAEKVIQFVEYFNHLDEVSPLLRLVIAGVIIGLSLLCLLITKLTVRKRFKRMMHAHHRCFKPLRLQRQDLVSSKDMKRFRIIVLVWVGRALMLFLCFTTITGFLMLSQWTLTLAAQMIGLLLAPLKFAWSSAIEYLPNLITIIVICALARFLVHTISLVFDGIKRRRIHIPNFYPEWADPSYGITRLLIYTMTAVIIFPYLPGSSSPAFRGISIFIGLLVSLGSTTAVANVVAGTVLTYTRALKIGDQVSIDDIRGRVVERSTFVTRIQTLKSVIVSVPNSKVLNTNIVNYSQNRGRRGLFVHTSITIGYDVPWQQVHELLIAAARKTEHIESDPEPYVLQTSLDDNYVSYEINGWTQNTEMLPKIYSNLHANILDQFHGHQVEITSPAYQANRDGSSSTIPESRS